MSTGPTSTLRRERALRAARLRLRRLEIETHRIKAELARLEAEFEDDVADRLSQTIRDRDSRTDDIRLDEPHGEPLARIGPPVGIRSSRPCEEIVQSGEVPPRSLARARTLQTTAHGNAVSADCRRDSHWPAIVSTANEHDVARRGVGRPKGRAIPRREVRSLYVSLAFHVVALCVVLPWTFPILAQQEAWLFAGPATLPDDTAEELNEIRFEPLEWENTTPRQVVFDEPTADLADDLLSDLLPTASVSAATPVAIPGALDSDLAGTSAGEAAVGGTSGPIDGPRGGRSGATTFFGTRSRGDRFVFVVDNSSSMKEGRLEAAIAELVRCIDALGPRQSFYVIFVSDQTYPMYYPQPAADLVAATPPNKQRLADWLQKVRLAGGKNRELITAMDKAAALRPHAVFLLWDGRIDDLTVRRDVITHLTRPNQWPFPVHTLGMGAMSAESEQNLAAIAQAQRGLYRRVDVPGPNAR